MSLVSFPDNPMPDGVVGRTVLTEDGCKLRAATWLPDGPVRGTVCVVQGRAETIEKYFEVVQELLSRRFAVATFDWRGQGGSDRRLANRLKGHVDDFAEYGRDLDAFYKQIVLADCPKPHFVLAHSTGGLICLRAASRHQLPFERMVLTAPLLGLGRMNPPRWFVQAASGALSFLGMNDGFPPGAGLARIDERDFDGNPLTSDERRFRRTMGIAKSTPELVIGPPTIGWLHAACREMVAASDPAFAAAIQVPTLIVTAGADAVVAPLAIERFVREMRVGAEIVIPGSRHEILMERDAIRSLFWAAFDAFIPGTPAVVPA